MFAIAPIDGNAEHDRAVDLRRRDHPTAPPRRDPHRQRQQREAVRVRRKRLKAAIAIGAIGARDAATEADRDDAEQQRRAVGEHVGGLGEQRDRVRPEAATASTTVNANSSTSARLQAMFARVLRVVMRVARDRASGCRADDRARGDDRAAISGLHNQHREPEQRSAGRRVSCLRALETVEARVLASRAASATSAAACRRVSRPRASRTARQKSCPAEFRAGDEYRQKAFAR